MQGHAATDTQADLQFPCTRLQTEAEDGEVSNGKVRPAFHCALGRLGLPGSHVVSGLGQ